jgi:DNA-binding IclR family transcriptional regulator
MTSMRADRSSQTLQRALDIIDRVASGSHGMGEIQASLGLTRSTAHRLAHALEERGLLSIEGRRVSLGQRLLYLGAQARDANGLIEVARPRLEALTAETSESTNLGVLIGDEVIYVAQVEGQRRLTVRHRVGDRNLAKETALGRALLLDAGPDRLEALLALSPAAEVEAFRAEMDLVLARGYAAHIQEGGDRICCLAAPVRDASGGIVAAVSVSSIPQYMDAARIEAVAPRLLAVAMDVSVALGHAPGNGAGR